MDDGAKGRILSHRSSAGAAASRLVDPPHHRSRVEEVEFGVRNLGAHLVEHTEIIQDPERPPLGGNHQITALDRHVGDRSDREVQLERPPAHAVVADPCGPGPRAPLSRSDRRGCRYCRR